MMAWCDYCHEPVYDEDIRWHEDKSGWVFKHHGETRLVSETTMADPESRFRRTNKLFGPNYRKVFELWQNLYPSLKIETVYE